MFKKNELAFSRVMQVKWLVFKCFESWCLSEEVDANSSFLTHAIPNKLLNLELINFIERFPVFIGTDWCATVKIIGSSGDGNAECLAQ